MKFEVCLEWKIFTLVTKYDDLHVSTNVTYLLQPPAVISGTQLLESWYAASFKSYTYIVYHLIETFWALHVSCIF